MDKKKLAFQSVGEEAAVDGKILQKDIDDHLQALGVKEQISLWSFDVKDCPMGLKFGPNLTIDLVKQLNATGYNYTEPAEFLNQVLTDIYGVKITRCMKQSGRTLSIHKASDNEPTGEMAVDETPAE